VSPFHESESIKAHPAVLGASTGDELADDSVRPLKMRVFGTTVALHGARELPLGPPRHRALLGLLLVRLGQVVPVPQLIDELWGDRPPQRPTATLHTYISHLRRALSLSAGPEGASTLVRYQAPGYVLTLSPEQVDAYRFERLVIQARRDMSARDYRAARDRLTAALALWRGDPYLDLVDYAPMAEESARLEQTRLTAVELQAETYLALGEDDAVVARLYPEAQRYPMRECLIGYLMTGLYRLGRQSDALRLFERTRAHLADELGVDAGAELQRIHTSILRQDLTFGDHAAVHVGVREERVDAVPLPLAEAPTGGDREEAVTSGSHTWPVTFGEQAESSEGARVPHSLQSLPFVGRNYELAVLTAWASAALSGEGGLAAVTGQAGIGKTELTAEVARGVREAGREVISVSFRSENGPAYGMWAPVLRRLSTSRPEAFRAAGARYGRVLGGLLPALSLGTAQAVPDEQPPPQAPFLVEDAVCSVLASLAREQPLLLVLDDLQSADYFSLNLLHLLVCRLPDVPLGILVTSAEPGSMTESPSHAALKQVLGHTRAWTLRLGGLSEHAVAALVAAQVEADVEAEAILALHKRSEGNPYALRQLLSLA
jgi:DNA-binding SARP family transcriptional activator